MNCTQHIGRLTADPEPLRTTDHGPVTTFRLAVPRAGSSRREADFFTVEAWAGLAETCAKHLTRGREVAVVGRLEQREWRTPADEPHERVVIVARSVRFLRGGRKDDGVLMPPGAPAEDDIPF